MFKTSTRCPSCHRLESKPDRSSQQNRYYWGVCVALLSEHTGFDREEMHEILKHKFLRRTVWINKKDGVQEQSIITKSTTKMTTAQFEAYILQIQVWASSELGVVLPSPNEQEGAEHASNVNGSL